LKKAIITGITGQDGEARYRLNKKKIIITNLKK
jgi:hypothetical protein